MQTKNDMAETTAGRPDDRSLFPFIGKRTLVPSQKRRDQLKALKEAPLGQRSLELSIAKRPRATPKRSSRFLEDLEPSPTKLQKANVQRTSHRLGSAFDDDNKLYDQVSKENRDFVSAKSFGESTDRRRKQEA